MMLWAFVFKCLTVYRWNRPLRCVRLNFEKSYRSNFSNILYQTFAAEAAKELANF